MSRIHKIHRIAVAVALAALALPFLTSGQRAPAQEALGRFPVAHEHGGSWCLGYLYIYPDSITYEVTSKDKSHAFVLKRVNMESASRWLRSGQPVKAAEVRSSKATYHFWWLANEQDVVNGKPYQNNPPDVGDPDYLIAAILDPATLSKEPAAPPQNPGAANASPFQQIPDSPLASALQPSGAAGASVSPVPAEVRFPVAHLHSASQCVGYLYISAGRVRFEVVQPQNDKKHGFDLSRSEIMTIQQWIVLKTPMNAGEIKTSHGNFHFLLLPDGADLVSTPANHWNVNNVPPIGSSLPALQGQR
jgi:hypothetical protein